jgi:predicted metal-binding membrane protein
VSEPTRSTPPTDGRAQGPGSPLVRQQRVLLATLLGLAAVAWAVLVWQSGRGMAMGDREGMAMGDREGAMAMGEPSTLDLTAGMSAGLFLAMWVVMMAAMMFPTAAPMVLMFARVHAGKRRRGQSFVPTWVFTLAYLALWTAFGAVAYLLASAASGQLQRSMWLADNASRIAAVAIILAGVYQLTPLKRVCLRHCRSPLAFVTQHWREGRAGSFLMGLQHGGYCLGCCWLLFVLLFPIGVMNLAAMLLITALIFAEKALPAGERTARFAAAALIGYGALVLAVPAALPLSA